MAILIRVRSAVERLLATPRFESRPPPLPLSPDLGGEIVARLALDGRDERTALAIVEPGRKLFPPEPLCFVGGSLVRRALLAKDAAED